MQIHDGTHRSFVVSRKYDEFQASTLTQQYGVKIELLQDCMT